MKLFGLKRLFQTESKIAIQAAKQDIELFGSAVVMSGIFTPTLRANILPLLVLRMLIVARLWFGSNCGFVLHCVLLPANQAGFHLTQDQHSKWETTCQVNNHEFDRHKSRADKYITW